MVGEDLGTEEVIGPGWVAAEQGAGDGENGGGPGCAGSAGGCGAGDDDEAAAAGVPGGEGARWRDVGRVERSVTTRLGRGCLSALAASGVVLGVGGREVSCGSLLPSVPRPSSPPTGVTGACLRGGWSLRTRSARSGCSPGEALARCWSPLLIDLETCCRGPVEFDLAHAPEEVCEHYPNLDQGLLDECRQLVLAMLAAWRWELGDQFPNGRRFGEEFLRLLREGPPWPTFDAVIRRLGGL